MSYQKMKGTVDIFPSEASKWQYVEQVATDILRQYQFKEIRLPLFESFDLFARGVGESTDVVSKEMYDFYDKGDRHIALRPEGTAGAVRAFVENKYYGPEHHKPQKYYYIGPMFRYERPQSGRQRQFYQLGVEVFGSKNPATDVETMALAVDLFQSLGLERVRLVINSLGSNESRAAFRQALIDYLEPFSDQLSDDSKRRLHENPLRVLDSKAPEDKKIVANAPSVLDFLDEESAKHFAAVKEQLDLLNIPYEVDANMVRGLDYYNDTVFEVITDHEKFGANTTIAGGGRYDGLVETVGGPATPAFGFGFGLERLLMLMEYSNVQFPTDPQLDVFIVTIGQRASTEATKLAHALRQRGLLVEREFMNRKPGTQFKSADKLNARFTFTLGDRELEKNTVNVKNMATGQELSMDLADVYSKDFRENFQEIKDELK